MTGASYPGSVGGGQNSLLLTPRGWKADGSGKGIIAIHGHGGNCLQYLPAPGSAGDSARELSDQGFAVLSGDTGGTTGFGDSAVMAAIDALYTYLQTGPAKTRNGKVGLVGWSMGSLAALNWIKRNPTKVSCAWLWAPLTDLDWAQANPAYTSEVNAAYGGNYALNSVGYRVHDEPASFRGICPIRMVHATDDATIPVSQTQNFVAQVADPLVTMRSPDIVGGHTGLFSNVPVAEFVSFFTANVV